MMATTRQNQTLHIGPLHIKKEEYIGYIRRGPNKIQALYGTDCPMTLSIKGEAEVEQFVADHNHYRDKGIL